MLVLPTVVLQLFLELIIIVSFCKHSEYQIKTLHDCAVDCCGNVLIIIIN